MVGPPLPNEPRYLSPKAAAGRACVSLSLIYRWCSDGSLPHLRVGGRGRRGKILIAPADLDGLMATFRVGDRVPWVAPVSREADTTPLSVPAGTFSELNPQRLARAWNSR